MDEKPKHTLGRRPNEARREQVRKLYLNGMSLRMIAQEVGTTYQAVHSLLVRMGVPLRPQGGNSGPHSRHRK